jgi:hypothetical protein
MTTRRAPEMEKYVTIIQTVNVSARDEYNVFLQTTNQRFWIGNTVFTLEEAEWMRDMLCIALAKIGLVNEWRPIDTAPKDHRIRLLLPSGREVHGQWSDDRHAKKPRPFWEYEGGGCPRISEMRERQPTHWMPIPEAQK